MSSTSPTSKRSISLDAVAVALLVAAPPILVFLAYVAWVIKNGGDPADAPGTLHAAISAPLLTARNILGIFVNGAFYSVMASLCGVIAFSMYGACRIAWGPQTPATYDATLDSLIDLLQEKKGQVGGHARIAVSVDGCIRPFELRSLKTGPLVPSAQPAPDGLILKL